MLSESQYLWLMIRYPCSRELEFSVSGVKLHSRVRGFSKWAWSLSDFVLRDVDHGVWNGVCTRESWLNISRLQRLQLVIDQVDIQPTIQSSNATIVVKLLLNLPYTTCRQRCASKGPRNTHQHNRGRNFLCCRVLRNLHLKLA